MFDNTPYPVLAERFGVSTRTIYKDVEQALAHCARRLGKKSFFKIERRQLSGKQKDVRS
jgi:DNA-directed RNA polymerase specialized sigma24 family protein